MDTDIIIRGSTARLHGLRLLARRTPAALALVALLGLAGLLGHPARAAAPTVRVVINGLSWHYAHVTPRAQLHQANPGLGLEYRPHGRQPLERGYWAAQASTYIDSYGGHAWLAAGAYRWHIAQRGGWYIDAGLLGGLTHRRLHVGDTRHTVAAVLPLVTVGRGPVELTLTAAPRIRGVIDDAAVAAQISWRI